MQETTSKTQVDAINSQEPYFLQAAKRTGYICPACGNGSGGNGTGIVKDPNSGRWHCFKCQLHEDIVGLFGIANRIEGFRDKVEGAAAFYQVEAGSGMRKASGWDSAASGQPPKPKAEPKPDFTDFYREAHSHISETSYPQQRGLSQETIAHFNLGYVPDWRPPDNPNSPPSPRLIVPANKHSYLSRDTRPDAPKAYDKMKAGNVSLFNVGALQEATKPIFIVEGEIDAMSIVEAGGGAVGLGSTSNVGALLKLLESEMPAHPLVVALDNDEAGEKAAGELAGKLEALGIAHCRINPYGDRKDANDALVANREVFIMEIAKAEEAARKKDKPTEAVATSGDAEALEIEILMASTVEPAKGEPVKEKSKSFYSECVGLFARYGEEGAKPHIQKAISERGFDTNDFGINTTIDKALKYFNAKIKSKPGYIPPEDYNFTLHENADGKTDKFATFKGWLAKQVSIRLKYDSFKQAIEYERAPWAHEGVLSDTDGLRLLTYVNRIHGALRFSTNDNAYYRQLLELAEENKYDSGQDFFNGIPKPEEGAQPTGMRDLFRRVLGINDDLSFEMIGKSLFATYKRQFEPGIKFDSVVCLIGEQGIGKSTIWRKLVGDSNFSDSLTFSDLRDKTAAEKLQGILIAEFAEMSGYRRQEIETVKQFISSNNDKFRAPYAKAVTSHKRRAVLVVTANELNLRDLSNRRFWIVQCDKPENSYGNADALITDEEARACWQEVLYSGLYDKDFWTLSDVAAAAERAKQHLDIDDWIHDALVNGDLYTLEDGNTYDYAALYELINLNLNSAMKFTRSGINDKKIRAVMTKLGWQFKQSIRINNKVTKGFSKLKEPEKVPQYIDGAF